MEGNLLPWDREKPADTDRGEAPLTPPTIQALGIQRHWWTRRWQATGYVEGVGWLEAWGPSLIEAMEALQALAARRVAEHTEERPPC